MSKLSLKEKISYGLGDFGNGFMFDMGQIYLLKFYTDVFGIPAAVVLPGLLFLIRLIMVNGKQVKEERGLPIHSSILLAK